MAVRRAQLTAEFPANLPPLQLENVHCAVLNLCAAIMEYVAKAVLILRRPVVGVCAC